MTAASNGSLEIFMAHPSLQSLPEDSRFAAAVLAFNDCALRERALHALS